MLIKQGLEEKYAEYVSMNSADDYSKACVEAGEVFGTALDEGKTPEEANDIMCAKEFGLTGFMAGCIMGTMVEFNPRGEEVKTWWNKYWGGTGEEDGVVNPAIVTIKE